MKTLFSITNKAGQFISSQTERQPVLISLILIIGMIYIISASLVGVHKFSQDSWSYFELSKSVFSGDFYRFNTIRSHFAETYSAAFPMGYPVALSAIQLIAGKAPEAALLLNCLIVVATAYILIKISDEIQLPRIYGISIAFSLLFYIPYIDEALAGRSMPLAILLFSLAGLNYLRGFFWGAGIFLGLSALVRFDFLVHSIIFLLAGSLNKWHEPKIFLLMVSGFFIGIIPWPFYSYLHFGKFWISDNSWVAMSALPARVLDYPATPIVSASENFTLWLSRVTNNTYGLLKDAARACMFFPLLPVLLGVALCKIRYSTKAINARLAIGAILIASATLPYLLTGYFTIRYYAPHLLCAAFLLAKHIVRTKDIRIAWLSTEGIVVISVFFALTIGLFYLSKSTLSGYARTDDMRKELQIIESLRQCHVLNPELTYIFDPASGLNYFKYGAITGMRAAGLPANFRRMSENQKEDFFSHMMPYAWIEAFSNNSQCPSARKN
ncbi:hypothetical protein [Azotobacter armeniacus]